VSQELEVTKKQKFPQVLTQVALEFDKIHLQTKKKKMITVYPELE
jgi:hypothetical protein